MENLRGERKFTTLEQESSVIYNRSFIALSPVPSRANLSESNQHNHIQIQREVSRTLSSLEVSDITAAEVSEANYDANANRAVGNSRSTTNSPIFLRGRANFSSNSMVSLTTMNLQLGYELRNSKNRLHPPSLTSRRSKKKKNGSAKNLNRISPVDPVVSF